MRLLPAPSTIGSAFLLEIFKVLCEERKHIRITAFINETGVKEGHFFSKSLPDCFPTMNLFWITAVHESFPFQGMLTQYSGQPGQEPPTLRLLCSITGGSAPAQWEDITGTTQLTFTGDEVGLLSY